MFTLKILAAALFVMTGGAVFSDRFRKYRALAIVAALISLAATYYLLRDIVSDAVLSARGGSSEAASIGPGGASAPGSAPQTVPVDTAALCGGLQQEWARTGEHTVASELREFLSTVPAPCLSLRSQVTLKIQQAETAELAAREDTDYYSARSAKTQTAYNQFLQNYPNSAHNDEIRRLLSSCRQVLVQTDRYSDQSVSGQELIFDAQCRNVADCDSIDAAARRASARCVQGLEAQCTQAGGSLSNVSTNPDASTCGGQCRVYMSDYRDQCD
ncbi:MAG: hypothetical protein WAU68_15095 [Vitreimonas sp.]